MASTTAGGVWEQQARARGVRTPTVPRRLRPSTTDRWGRQIRKIAPDGRARVRRQSAIGNRQMGGGPES